VTLLIRSDTPLEQLLRSKASTNGIDFPNHGINYYDRYVQIKQHLATKYYQNTGAGLARSGQRFTKHDITHVDDVIHRAGQLVGAGNEGTQPYSKLTPYEIFSLLYAILLHDAGNAHERTGHEARAFDIIMSMGDLSALEDVEKHLIASIAQAHGGKTADGNRDTIPALIREDVSSFDGIEVHGRRLAALLRLADELSENSRRADEISLQAPYTPPESFLPNLYCKKITTQINVTAGSISLKYMLTRSDLISPHPDPENGNQPTLVVDYIAKRITKCDQERRYCNRFLNGFALMDRMRAALEVYEGPRMIDEVKVDLSDTGYPTIERTVQQRESRFDGETLRRTHLDPAETGVA
jgi:hypothetical protein